MFVADLKSVKTLKLTLDHRPLDFGFLRGFHQLQILEMKIFWKLRSLDELVDIGAGLQIRSLKITCSVDGDTLDLRKFFQNYASLESLKLCGVDFFAEHCIPARQLKELDLRSVEYLEEFTLDAPNLTHLTLEVDILNQMGFVNATSLTSVRLLLTLQNALEQFVYPFLRLHENVTHLALIADYRAGNYLLDRPTNDTIELNVERLDLQRSTATMNFFRMIAEWKSLQILTLIGCTIDCVDLEDSERLGLPFVKHLVIEQHFRLRNTKRTDFPLLAQRTTERQCD